MSSGRASLAGRDDTSVVAGTNVIYAAAHHFGDPQRGIPARPFLGGSTDARYAVLETIVGHLERRPFPVDEDLRAYQIRICSR